MTQPIASWINKAETRNFPEWVKAAMANSREPNGTFLINTKRGRVRVHVGHMVFRRNDEIFCCHPMESRQLIAQLKEEARGVAHLNEAARREARIASGSSGSAKAKPKRCEAEVADRADDTDEISRRIQAQALPATAAAPAVPTPTVDTTVFYAPVARAGVAPKTTKQKFPAPLGMPPSIEMRHAAELKVDDSYQRSIDTGPSRALIDRIARDWDWRMCLPLVVSKRADGLYVIDGQHRHAAALKRGDIPFLPCCIAVYRDVAEEAAMFVAMNRSPGPDGVFRHREAPAMTRQQHQLLAFIRSYKAEHDGLSPTIREMRDGIGINSASSICRLLDDLERDGRIERERDGARRARRRHVRIVGAPAGLIALSSADLIAECRRRGLEVAA